MANIFTSIISTWAESWLNKVRYGSWVIEDVPFQGLYPTNAVNAYAMYRLFSPLQKCVNEINRGTQNTKPWVYNDNGSVNQFKSLKYQRLHKELIMSGDLRLLVVEALVHGVVFMRKRTKGIYLDGYEILQNRFAQPLFIKGKLVKFFYKGVEIAIADIKIIDLEGKTSDENNLFVSERLLALQKQLNAYNFLQETLREIFGFGGARKLVSFDNGDSESFGDHKTEKEQEEAKKDLNENTGNRTGQRRFITVKAKASTHDLASKVGDLQAPEVNKLLREEVSVLFNVPPILLGAGAAAYNKIAEARLDFFESFVIPFANQLLNSYYSITGTKVSSTEYVEQEMGHLSFAQIANSRRASTIQQTAQGLSNLVKTGIKTTEQASEEFDANI